MDLDFVSLKDEPYSKKVLHNTKGAYSNGFMLQVRPTFTESHGEYKSCVFKHCSFSENNLLAISDTSGNVYIIDLEMQKYWEIPSRGIVSAVSFPRILNSRLLIALSTGCIQIMYIETGTLTGTLIGHSMGVKEISYSYDGKYCLTSNLTEAIIWDILSNNQIYKLALKDDSFLKKATFIPMHSYIFACFNDDTMHIWKFGEFEQFQQIIPEGWRRHHIKSVAFTKNGCLMAVGGNTPNITIFCLDSWNIKTTIKLSNNACGTKYMEFISQIFDDGGNKILGILTKALDICFVDIENSVLVNKISNLHQSIGCFNTSPTGKFLACILTSGEINIYVSQKLLKSDRSNGASHSERICNAPKNNLDVSDCGRVANRKSKARWVEQLAAVHTELKEELNLKKLFPILKQFGEYPESYRTIIWRTVLQLPLNQEAFISIASKEYHPSWVFLESKYPLVNRTLCSALKRILSSLAYWCPLFGEVEFLPEFVFPFVKLLHFDPLVCFETVATIIKNWCQKWFEFYPFPPINILSLVENLLAYHDPDLLEFYYTKNITCSVYACILMQTAFSEVLTRSEWLKLWDHIISNEPSFIITAIVTYNIICRNGIKNCDTDEDIEDKTPPEVHPRHYLDAFSPLKKGDIYTPYEDYPKLIVDKNAEKLYLIQKEEQTLLDEERKVMALRKELDKKLGTGKRADIREEILTELDEKFRHIVNTEEQRISQQRKKLQQLRHELRLKELTVLEDAREELLKKRSQKMEAEMKRLLNELAARKSREKSEIEAIEEDIRKYYASLLLRKHRLKMNLEMNDYDRTEELADNLKEEEGKLMQELDELRNDITDSYHDRKTDIASKISKATEILQNIETEIKMEMIDARINSEFVKNKIVMENLWKELKTLEKKFQRFSCKEKMKNSPISRKKQAETPTIEEKCSLHDTPEFTHSTVDSSTRYQSSHRESSINSMNFDSMYKKDVIPDNILERFGPNGEYVRDKINERNGEIFREMQCKKSTPVENEKRKGQSFRKNRSKFTECSTNPSLLLACKANDSSESLMESDSQHNPEMKNKRKSRFRKRKAHLGSKGDENCTERSSHSSLSTASLEKFRSEAFFPVDASPCSTQNGNSAIGKAFDQRRKLIEMARQHYSSS